MATEKILGRPEVEEDFFACIFQRPRLIGHVVDLIKADDFYRDRHQVMYSTMLSLMKQGRRCSAENVWDEIVRMGKREVLGDLQKMDLEFWANDRIGTLQPIEEHIYTITHYSTLRKLRAASAEIAKMVYADQTSAGEMVEASEKLIYEIAMGTGSKATLALGEVLDDYISDLESRVEDRKNGIARGVPTGFKDLDHMIGGLQPGMLYTLGALTSVGKSAWALNLAMNVVKNTKHALFFSLEMQADALAQRILSAEAFIDQSLLRDAWVEEDQIEIMRKKAEDLRKCHLEIDDTSFSLAEIKSRIRQSHAKKPLNLVVIDYLQLIRTDNNGRDRQTTRTEELSNLSRELLLLAHELDISILVLVQLNRNVEHRQRPVPKLADINESGGIARDSDVVMFLYTIPPKKKDDEEEDEEEEITDSPTYPVYLLVEKNRQGPKGEVTLLFRSRITKFETLLAPGEGITDETEN